MPNYLLRTPIFRTSLLIKEKSREGVQRDQELLQRHNPQQPRHDRHPQGGNQGEGTENRTVKLNMNTYVH